LPYDHCHGFGSKFPALKFDIALLPQWRRRGRSLGTALMDGVCAEARVAGKSVAVEKNNRAQTLYRWLGLREIADHGVHWDMEWGAAADQRTTVI
jgi:GNAT superfamily N-acetyltransferase